MTAAPPRTVAVIGAGAAGLSAAKPLLQRGLDVAVFEMGSCIGGLWVDDNDNGRSPAYDSLHINSEAAVTAYEDSLAARDAAVPAAPPHQLLPRGLRTALRRRPAHPLPQ